MSRARHKKSGGAANPPVKEVYAGAGSNVIKEAKERKRGGKVEGTKPKTRLDRVHRRTGGRVGADSHPLSSAAKVSTAMASK